MSAAIPKIFLQSAAIFLAGMVIKLTDDYLDDFSGAGPEGARSLAQKLGRGVAAYALLLFAVAVSLDAVSSCTLFLAAYAVGMGKDPNLILPTSIPAWIEAVLVTAGGILLWGWQPMVSSLAIMVGVQLIDDYLDQDLDWQEQRPNLVHRWGKVEVLLLLLIATAVSLQLDWLKTILVLVLAPMVNWVAKGAEKGRSCL
ncbi:MAG: hypothetical protein WBI83_00155 [bacterium]|nr:hypothetical protein [Bacillota bacterium]HHW54337.1 hypothetical protein [Bacillota bacterium]